MTNNLQRWSLTAVGLIYVVIILGAYTRLRDAGLGCPDWPGCYGQLTPLATPGLDNIEIHKAWIEMIHRYVAGALGLLILFITIKSILLRKQLPKAWMIACAISLLVVFQALLGMWTVTLRLYPIVVMGHLLGGFSIFALCWLLYLNTKKTKRFNVPIKSLNIFAYVCLCVLFAQIALGGWTSANYAALVCADFPSCQGSYWPVMDFKNAFNLTAVGIFDSPGAPLENQARVTIQMMHRLGALITAVILSILYYCMYRTKLANFKKLAQLGFGLLAIQIALGITNVLAGLPLAISLMHNAVAALLLILTITMIYVTC